MIAVPGIFSTNCHIFREIGNYLFMGKGIRIMGVELADFLNPVSIPQNATFSVEV
jgi:hypothetical protein